jgi:hypothetical protein
MSGRAGRQVAANCICPAPDARSVVVFPLQCFFAGIVRRGVVPQDKRQGGMAAATLRRYGEPDMQGGSCA